MSVPLSTYLLASAIVQLPCISAIEDCLAAAEPSDSEGLPNDSVLLPTCPVNALIRHKPTSKTRWQSLRAHVSTVVGLPPLGEGEMAKTILVADDNPEIRKQLCELFGSEQDYDICAEATNGQEAIDLALEWGPDLIILDLSMPVMNGLEAARELKRLMPDVPIILFTQYADLGRHTIGSDLSVDCVVSKSETKALMTHVRSLIPV